MLAQTAHEPPFPIVNQNIYFGQNMMAPIRAPVLSPVILFQPTLWGFFLGRDLGVSWLWWTLVFGTFLSAFLFFLEMTQQDRFLSFCGSLLVVFSPFFQLWSFHKAEVFAGALFSFVFFFYLLRAETVAKKLCWAIALGWALGEFAFGHIYPPYQVTLAYFCFLLAAAHINKASIRLSGLANASFVFLSLAILSAGAFFFLMKGGESLHLLADTEYPGKRFSTGGGFFFWEYFSNQFFLRHWVKEYGPLANICESAFGFLFFPGLALSAIWPILKKEKADALSLVLLTYGVLLFLYSVIGMPEGVARLTFFSKVPSNRVGLVLVLIDITLLLRLLSLRQKANRFSVLILFLLLLGSGFQLRSHLPELPAVLLWGCPILFSVLFYGLFETRLWKKSLITLVVISFLYSMSFQPIVRGGTSFLYENPLSAKILEIHGQDPTGRWAAFGLDNGGDLLRLLGVPAIGGYQGVPNLQVWSAFDPEGKYKPSYNIAGLVYFQPSKDDSVRFEGNHQVLIVHVRPQDLANSSLNIRYFLIPASERALFSNLPGFAKLIDYGNFSVFGRQ